jgi:predicted transcriptional regulator
MTVENFAKDLGFEVVCMPDGDREVNGAYIGDLLSWVMGRAGQDNVWITIMSNLNIVAVATLSDVSCILLAEGVRLDDEVRRVAEEKSVNVLSTSLSAYAAASLISKTLC